MFNKTAPEYKPRATQLSDSSCATKWSEVVKHLLTFDHITFGINNKLNLPYAILEIKNIWHQIILTEQYYFHVNIGINFLKINENNCIKCLSNKLQIKIVVVLQLEVWFSPFSLWIVQLWPICLFNKVFKAQEINIFTYYFLHIMHNTYICTLTYILLLKWSTENHH